MKTRIPKIGTISHGTLRTEDLVRSLSSEYERLGGRLSNVRHFGNVILGKNLAASHDEELLWALEDLFDLLNEMAEEGTYFGALEGDGSDFGFWPISDVPDEVTVTLHEEEETLPLGDLMAMHLGAVLEYVKEEVSESDDIKREVIETREKLAYLAENWMKELKGWKTPEGA